MYKLISNDAIQSCKSITRLQVIASKREPSFLESYSISKNGSEVYFVEHITIKVIKYDY